MELPSSPANKTVWIIRLKQALVSLRTSLFRWEMQMNYRQVYKTKQMSTDTVNPPGGRGQRP